jgi:hypothetical protein
VTSLGGSLVRAVYSEDAVVGRITNHISGIGKGL